MDFESLMYGYRLGSRAMFAEPRQTTLGMMGTMLSRSSGSSLEFMEHREYLPGDDLRRIDWNAYARSDRLAVKLFREEVNPHVDLLLDVSRSMNLAGTKKGEATYALIGFFASAAAESRFSFRVFITDNGCRTLERSSLLPMDWEPFDLTSTNSPKDALFRMPPDWKPHGIRIFVSDFLFMADPEFIVSQIIGDASVTMFVQLLAESETEPPQQGNLRLTDCESGEQLECYLDLLSREQYKQNLARHQENYHLAARRYGTSLITVIAERFLETGRLDELFHLELLKYNETS
jgi:uncharacterized protein (DUF58 family)